MATMKVKSETFNKNGQDITYERFVIESESNKELKIELRLEPTEMTLVKAILSSDPTPKK